MEEEMSQDRIWALRLLLAIVWIDGIVVGWLVHS
jgi:hypothetical protein